MKAIEYPHQLLATATKNGEIQIFGLKSLLELLKPHKKREEYRIKVFIFSFFFFFSHFYKN